MVKFGITVSWMIFGAILIVIKFCMMEVIQFLKYISWNWLRTGDGGATKKTGDVLEGSKRSPRLKCLLYIKVITFNTRTKCRGKIHFILLKHYKYYITDILWRNKTWTDQEFKKCEFQVILYVETYFPEGINDSYWYTQNAFSLVYGLQFCKLV
jgi:hypothetical protein